MLIEICLAVMVLLMFLRAKQYNINRFLSIPLAICVAAMGYTGTRIMFFIENGEWYGKSFFGAVLFFPILLWPISMIFKIQLKDILNYSTPPGMALLAISKWKCYVDGCCGGRVLWFSEEGIPTHFPSQLSEMTAAIIITILLLILEQKPKLKGKIYPLCLVIYGITRYLLNLFRWEQGDFLFGTPAGNIWAMVSFFIGIIWLMIINGKERWRA